MTFFGVANIYGFLAVTKTVPANILVVDSWFPDYAMDQLLAEFEAGDYDYICTTGGPLSQGHFLSEYNSCAELSAAMIRGRGFEEGQLIVAPSPVVLKLRTREAARSVKRKLETLDSVGLSYLKLGQPATTLSGGEAQRVKLAAELTRRHPEVIGVVRLAGRPGRRRAVLAEAEQPLAQIGVVRGVLAHRAQVLVVAALLSEEVGDETGRLQARGQRAGAVRQNRPATQPVGCAAFIRQRQPQRSRADNDGAVGAGAD